MDDIIIEFLAETNDSLSELDNDLLLLEQNPDDAELISKIFRILHTIKGTCGFLGLSRMEKVAHKGEDLLGLFRDRKLAVTPAFISLILESFDVIKDIIAGLEATGKEPDGSDNALISKLETVCSTGKMPEEPVAMVPGPSPEPDVETPSSEVAAPVSTLESVEANDPLPPEDASVPVEEPRAGGLGLNAGILDQLMTMVTELSEQPDNPALLSKILRVLGTIHKMSSYIGFARLESISERTESILSYVHESGQQLQAADVALIHEAFLAIRTLMTSIETEGVEPDGDDSALMQGLDLLLEEKTVLATQAQEICLSETPSPKVTEDKGETVEVKDSDISDPESSPPQPSHPLPLATRTATAEVEASGGQEKAATDLTGAQTLRVNVDVLENLMTMVSELVLTRNQLLQISRQNKENEFQVPLQRLNHVVSDLQEGVMKTRMQPIGNAWQKLPRIVRDVAKELGKVIELEMIGQETELDRQILDMIKDPLTHMVRNSADHGVERPEDRIAAGKPEGGKITLHAYHQGGHIIIEIADDGRGLALDKIKKKIVANNLASEEQLAVMSVQQIQQYIFHAGFSTADQITAVSGRGVGMDVVRSNIEKIGGSIEMRSEEGKGTTFTIKIPLTLAIVSALIVDVAGQRFAIPQLAISELVLVGAKGNSQIETINNAKVIRLRETLLPLVSLASLLKIEPSEESDTQYIVVTKVGGTMFGLIVDHVYDLEEIVIKPLARCFKSIGVFSGNTILGDGCVIMILDPAGILKTAGVTEQNESRAAETSDTEKVAQKENLLLLFKAGDDTLKATPINMVSRLEEIDMSTIEYANGRPVIQYLGHLMPVYSLDKTSNEEPQRPLIILKHEGKSTGLIADQILDITKFYGEIDLLNDEDISDSIIIQDHAADIVNARLIAEKGIVINETEAAHA